MAQKLLVRIIFPRKINEANINYKARLEMHPIIWLPKNISQLSQAFQPITINNKVTRFTENSDPGETGWW